MLNMLKRVQVDHFVELNMFEKFSSGTNLVII